MSATSMIRLQPPDKTETPVFAGPDVVVVVALLAHRAVATETT